MTTQAPIPKQVEERLIKIYSGLRQSGIFQIPQRQMVLAFLAGSGLHGASIEGESDTNISGVYMESPMEQFGLPTFWQDAGKIPVDNFEYKSSGGKRKNGAEDVDVICYSLRRWAKLALSGNPNALRFLFVTGGREAATLGSKTWETILPFRDHFLSKLAASHYLQFARSQTHRLLGHGTGKHGQRDDLIARHGYDTKAAMQIILLYMEAIELMGTGHITFPRPEVSELLRIRKGEAARSLREFEGMAAQFAAAAELAYQNTHLPWLPDYETVSRVVAEAYINYFGNEKRVWSPIVTTDEAGRVEV